MPQRAPMFLEGLARQPGDAISMEATTVGRLVHGLMVSYLAALV